MQLKELRLYAREGVFTTLVDPSNLENKFTHNLTKTRRNVGKDRIPTLSTTFKQYATFEHKPCSTECGVMVRDQVTVTLLGSNKDAILRAWEAMKVNVERAIETYDVLSGLPLPLNADGFKHVESLTDI